MKKLLKWIGISLLGLIGLLLLAGLILYPIGMKKLTRSYPNIHIETVNIPTNADAIARGRHVAVIWSCTECHGENMGGMSFTDDPLLGTISAPNLTPGEGGVGEPYTDTDWIRAIRHGVKPDSHAEVFMYDYATMSDQDLGDLIAYLKQVPPVDSDYPEMRLGPVVPIAPALALFPPAAELIDHDAPRPVDPVPASSIKYGQYLFAICAECHGAKLADELENWKQEDFDRAVQAGILPDGRQLPAAMSSKNFGEMNEMELTALWLYLTSMRP